MLWNQGGNKNGMERNEQSTTFVWNGESVLEELVPKRRRWMGEMKRMECIRKKNKKNYVFGERERENGRMKRVTTKN